MRKLHLAAILLLASAAAIGCADQGARITSPPGLEKPSFLLGPTTRVTVSCPDSIGVSETAQCSASGWDADNNFTGSTVSSWSSSDTNKVSVSSGGQVGGVATGSALISADMGGVIGSGTVVVVPER
ncbi:MAG TPA: hypothetical protein VFQ39_14320 [Longimicrobium sp.]|nr:hypothetical protein [Longimicrobium sp.]